MAKEEKLLEIKKSEQAKVVEKLIEESKPSQSFYLFLILSAIITACGLLVNSPSIVIGGMLVAPLLVPILTIGLSVSMGDLKFVWRSFKITGKASLTVVLVAAAVGLIFPAFGELNNEVISRIRPELIYFIIAFAAGMAATVAWSREPASVVLPGVAVAVSLVPPLGVFGITLSRLFEGAPSELIVGSFATFLFNLLGIAAGSLVVFSLMRFHESRATAKKEIKEEEREERE